MRKHEVCRNYTFVSHENMAEPTFVAWWIQANNQLGTPGGAKSFLRGAQIF